MSLWLMFRPAFQSDLTLISRLRPNSTVSPRAFHSDVCLRKDRSSEGVGKADDAIASSSKSSITDPYLALVSTSSLLPAQPISSKPSLTPILPKSTKSLNRLLGSSPAKLRLPPPILDKDVRETFIRGTGPGGQAINKLATNVSLLHIPTGIRVTYQETRDLQSNRRGARKLLGERLAALNADHSPLPSRGDVLIAKAKLKKERAKKRSRKKYGKGEKEEQLERIGPEEELETEVEGEKDDLTKRIAGEKD